MKNKPALTILLTILFSWGLFTVVLFTQTIISSSSISFYNSTSSGEIKRHADISSPLSGGYIYEDFHAIGSVEITETFSMQNIAPGVEARGKWDIFNDGPRGIPVAGNNNPVEAGNKALPANKNKKPPYDPEAVVETTTVAIPSWLDLF